jgi:hypothetical protein
MKSISQNDRWCFGHRLGIFQMNEQKPFAKVDFVALQERLPYAAPMLKVYGTVSHLTQGGNTSARSDSGKNNMWT